MSALRRCLSCGVLGRFKTRCSSCQSAVDARREQAPGRVQLKARRYNSQHRRTRRQWLPFVLAGTVRCGRSYVGQCLHADKRIAQGASWDLDHIVELGKVHPSHADCNRAAAQRNLAAGRAS